MCELPEELLKNKKHKDTEEDEEDEEDEEESQKITQWRSRTREWFPQSLARVGLPKGEGSTALTGPPPGRFEPQPHMSINHNPMRLEAIILKGSLHLPRGE